MKTIIELRNEGKTYEQIARELNCSVSNVYNHVRMHRKEQDATNNCINKENAFKYLLNLPEKAFKSTIKELVQLYQSTNIDD